jgi:hypothetical protein
MEVLMDDMHSPDIRRKHVRVDQAKLDRAVAILGATSEADAIDQALSLLVLRNDLIEGIERIGGSGGVDDVG